MDRLSSPRGIHRASRHSSGRNELHHRGRVRLQFRYSVLMSTTVLFDDARKQAEELDAEFASTRQLRGPLHGVPVSFKDQCMSLRARAIHLQILP
jgi:hypothetical protein